MARPAARSAADPPARLPARSRTPQAGPREAGAVGGSQTVDRALALVQLVAAAPGKGLRLADLAAASGLDRATAYRMLVSLAHRGFVDQDAVSKRYTLGLEFFTLAASASNFLDLGGIARDTLCQLAKETGDTATFCVRSNLNLICVDVETGSFPIKTLPMDIGSHRPIGAGASGIAMLAALPDFEVEGLLKKSARRLEEVPGQELDTIRTGIADYRKCGYALAVEDPMGRIMGLAVALLNRRGRPQSTLTLNAIPDRFSSDRLPELSRRVMACARTIEAAMWRLPDSDRHRAIWMKDKPNAARRSDD